MSENPYGRPPHHPDFDLLSKAVIEADDMATKGGLDVEGIFAEITDPDTALHFAQQRAMRLAAQAGFTQDAETIAALAALWLDGMWAGYKLAEAHNPAMEHDSRCDRDLCHPDCPIRQWAVANDRTYRGYARRGR